MSYSPICFGVVKTDGSIASGTGNFSAGRKSTGIYEIVINGEQYSTLHYPTVVTVIMGDDIPFDNVIYGANITSNVPNTLTVHIKVCFATPAFSDEDEEPADAEYVDSHFSFVVYKAEITEGFPPKK